MNCDLTEVGLQRLRLTLATTRRQVESVQAPQSQGCYGKCKCVALNCGYFYEGTVKSILGPPEPPNS